ncbi:MAG: glutamate racemase [Deltaproteobacteria bacterium CG_4_8_14_3_um_filter_51_11]|nr:glutamate racemase [bacterium]NCP10241.1 glutamate racemase [bacterium]OIP42376.1 MAG: glutamate racemase [Desulfobacteraceae bacterium CG2_30_51_40]PIX20312.1 MAG: glutamate racemase [Deltaproteobacteria bacterium CG_4_8_14_3_um_filter_51_11]PIY26676.1 MAG: glutamate racemase [Deltaproteobacteria bacterium CG_4_10_14_3_um_filter_51_14]
MIGVFDSGFGGLTILRAFLKALPDIRYVYLGDNARTPYGNKSQGVIYEYTRQAVEYLFGLGCVLVILACNTASTKALRKIQQEWLPRRYPDRRVLGVVIPLAEAGAAVTRAGRVGVIGTRATIESGVFDQELHKIRPELMVFGKACPLLVPLVEEDWVRRPETSMILKKYLRSLKDKRVDTLIPGCTHYPFLQPQIERIMGKSCAVVNGPEVVARKLCDYLKRHPEIDGAIKRGGNNSYFTTDDPERFMAFGRQFLCDRISEVKAVVLG